MRTIDAHAAGGPLRLVVAGCPAPRGRTMAAKAGWLARHGDDLRRRLLLEPRGHADMCGAVLTEPVLPGSHAGILFMRASGIVALSGHGVIAATTIALERGLLDPGGDGARVVFDTPAGTIRAQAHVTHAAGTGESDAPSLRVERVAYTNVPSFVLHAGLPVALAHRKIRADVAFGGAFYAIVDSEAAGLPIDAAHLPELRRAGVAIARAIEAAHAIEHPVDSSARGLAGTVFTAPPTHERASLRNVTIFADGQAERSPGGTPTAAVMAVVDAMGLLDPDAVFVHESLIGTRFTGRIAGRTSVGDAPAIVAEIEGSAWVTGVHTFYTNDDDPLDEGFRA